MIITIDGPTGTGKSTIAAMLAEKLGFIHVDTGAMYRCVTYGVIKHGIIPEDTERLTEFLDQFNFDITVVDGVKRYVWEELDITDAIRTEKVTALVSRVSAQAVVREKLVNLQRKLGNKSNTVFEGRDLGTVVFPNADLKIFLTAKPEVRAKRRQEELMRKFPDQKASFSFETILDSVNRRDEFDSNRELSPLKKADDAVEIDTSDLSVDQVLEKIVEIKENIAR